jgi:outer membrane immunogenic protein
MKKLALAALLSFSTSSFAAGFYLGAGLGPESAEFDQTSSIRQLSNFNVQNKTNQSGAGIFGSFFGGYGWQRQQFYVAGELNVNTSSVAFRTSNKEFIHSSFASTRYTIPFSWGVSVLPGYLISPLTLFFARLGFIQGNFRSDTSDISLQTLHKNLNGVRYGAGIRQSVTKNLSVVMDYSRISYQNVSMSTFDVTSSTLKNTTISPTTNQVQFALMYEFV